MATTMSVGIRILDIPQFRDFVEAAERVAVAAMPHQDTDPKLYQALLALQVALVALERRRDNPTNAEDRR